MTIIFICIAMDETLHLQFFFSRIFIDKKTGVLSVSVDIGGTPDPLTGT